MTNDERLEQAVAFLRLPGSPFTEAARQKCADALDTLREELARQEPFAWATFDGEQLYDLRLYEENEDYREDYIKRNGETYASWVRPLYASPQPAQAIVAELTHEELVQRPKRQYFYRVRDCPASSGIEARCICGHDEGAGPFPKGDAGTVSLEWRDTLQTSPQPKEPT